MTLHSAKMIRSLSRGIAVMRAMEKLRHASLDELYRQTAITKPTLSRILLTLQAERMISQRIADNRWVLGVGIGAPSHISRRKELLVQAAATALDRLCEQIIWPSDLSVRSGWRMVLMESSRPHSTLLFNRLKIGFEIDFQLSAPGRAYLAYCPEAEREKLIARLVARPTGAIRLDSSEIYQVIRRTREQGFGLRDPRWGGHTQKAKSEYDDGLNAVAVPIMHGTKVLGCINIAWIRKVQSRELMVSRNISALHQTAREIADNFVRLTHQESKRA